MAGLNSFDAASLRLLEKKINEIVTANTKAIALDQNCLVVGDINATAQNYSSAVNYIRGLNDALSLCREVEDELLGRTEKKPEAWPVQ